MMKKILICLCLILSLCVCTQNSVESDTTEDSDIVEVEENTEDTTDTNEEDKTVEDNETEENETSSNNSTDNSSSTTAQSSTSSNTSSSSDKSTSNSSTSNTNTTNQSSSTETIEEEKIYCTYTIDCSSVLDHLDDLESNYQVPSNGIIYSQTVEIEEGDTVMSILKRTGVSTDISLGYVKGIDGLYEFDCGSESGWTYSVNGTKPSVGASKYSVSEGDVIKWIYVVSRSEW